MALHEKAQGYAINAIVSNNPEAPALEWAAQHGIPTHTVSRNEFTSLADFKAGLLRAVSETAPDIVALAGFMVVLPPDFVGKFAGRLINIHPSILPKYPGLDTHQRALDAGDKQHGATVHFVAEGVDTGAIIAQGVIPVEPTDTVAILAARTLALEHKLYPWVLRYISSGEIALRHGLVTYSDRVRSAAKASGFILSESFQ
jgi:phosphoribosylglycinamide formyltransferase-1